MPHISGNITAWGPLINVIVGVSQPRAAALARANQQLPSVVVAKLVVDTGASQTSLDASILQQLQIAPTGSTGIHTPSTQGVPHVVNLFDVSILIPGPNPANPVAHVIPAIPVIEGQFRAQGIDGLLGRDILASTRFIYAGPDQIVLISF